MYGNYPPTYIKNPIYTTEQRGGLNGVVKRGASESYIGVLISRRLVLPYGSISFNM